MNKLLIVNCIQNQIAYHQFNQVFAPKFISEEKCKIIPLDSISKLFNLHSFSHLLLTGSELSAAENNPFDKHLYSMIGYFVENGKAVYGICYGHQMLAKWLQDESVCQKAKIPEFGWFKLKKEANHLFSRVPIDIFFSSHYDELTNLNSSFQIIAGSSPHCQIQAFQYRSYPIWGTQFHPEFDRPSGDKSLHDFFVKNPHEKKFYQNQALPACNQRQTFQIFSNFLSAGV